MLVSDQDRERAVELLKSAYVDGRLTLEELGHRTTAALQARTLAELQPAMTGLVGESPSPAGRRARRRPALGAWPVLIAVALILLFVQATHGHWLGVFPLFFIGFFFFGSRRWGYGHRR